MNIIGMLDRPTSGEYFLDGNDTSIFTDDDEAVFR
jgi:ABC-type lipoprotein export system ATPase subunit